MLERRAAERLKIQAVVDLSVGERSARAMAYDLSTDGCMLEAEKILLEAGSTVALAFRNGISASGKVVWTKHRNAGVQFAEAMPIAAVSRMADDCARPSPPGGISAQTAEHAPVSGRAFDQPLANASSPAGTSGYTAAASPLAPQKIASFFQDAVSVALIGYCALLLHNV